MNPLSELDDRLFYAIYGGGPSGGVWTTLALGLSAVGSGWIMFALVPLLGLLRWRPLALRLTGALVTSAVIVYGLKLGVGRSRPCAALSGVRALCAAPTDPSFPSGHACGSFTFAVFLFVVLEQARWPSAVRLVARVVLLGAALGVAWSRVYLGVHFPGDVTAGALLGTVVGGLWARHHLAKTSTVAQEKKH